MFNFFFINFILSFILHTSLCFAQESALLQDTTETTPPSTDEAEKSQLYAHSLLFLKLGAFSAFKHEPISTFFEIGGRVFVWENAFFSDTKKVYIKILSRSSLFSGSKKLGFYDLSVRLEEPSLIKLYDTSFSDFIHPFMEVGYTEYGSDMSFDFKDNARGEYIMLGLVNQFVSHGIKTELSLDLKFVFYNNKYSNYPKFIPMIKYSFVL